MTVLVILSKRSWSVTFVAGQNRTLIRLILFATPSGPTRVRCLELMFRGCAFASPTLFSEARSGYDVDLHMVLIPYVLLVP